MIDCPHPSSTWWFGSAIFVAALAAIALPGAAANQEPIAVAGNDSVLSALEPFVLNGSASYDPDGENLTCDWGWSGTPDGYFENRTRCTTTFFPAGSGIFYFRLTVRDADGVNYTQNYPDNLPAIGHGVAIDHVWVLVDNHAPHMVSSTPPAGDVFGAEGSWSSEKTYNSPAPAYIRLSARADDPDRGNISWQCFVEGARVSAEGSDLQGNGTCLLVASAGTYRVRAVVTDGFLNDSTEWAVHVSAYVDPRRASDQAIAVTLFFGVPSGIILGIAWAFVGRRRRR